MLGVKRGPPLPLAPLFLFDVSSRRKISSVSMSSSFVASGNEQECEDEHHSLVLAPDDPSMGTTTLVDEEGPFFAMLDGSQRPA